MNPEIKKILVPVDLSESSTAALETAKVLAKKLNAEIALLHVLVFNDYYFSIVPEVRSILPSIKEIELAAQKQMEEISSTIKKDSGINASVFVTTGNIEKEVFDFCKREKMDLIVMGTHGTSGYREHFIGSNAQRVVTLSKIPVLTIQGNATKNEFKNIMVPIDNSLHSREKLNIAIDFAELFGSKIHLLGLSDSADKKDLELFKVKLSPVEKLLTEKNINYETVILPGENVANAALKYAGDSKCDLIVINTGHESKTTGIFLGTFAQQIVNHSKVPVLSYRHTEGEYLIDTQGYGI